MCGNRQGSPSPWIALFTTLLLAAAPLALANVAPETALLIHVQQPGDGCDAVANCTAVANRTEQLGQVEFLLLFSARELQSGSEPLEIYSFHTDLVWPESWVFVNGWWCSGATGSFDWEGAGPHALDMQFWPCAELPQTWDGVFPLARLIFNTDVPGRIGAESYWDGASAVLGCPPSSFTVSTAVCFAEVGFACEYNEFSCGYSSPCGASFADTQLELSALPGGSAQAETELTIGDLCGWFQVETLADWLDVGVTEIEPDHYRLLVTADATDLPPGDYDSWVRALLPQRGHCLPVAFRVQDPTGVEELPAGQAQETSWSRVKALYR